MTSVNIADFPSSIVVSSATPNYDVGRRRVLIFVVAPIAAAGQSINLADFVPNLVDIEGEFFNTIANYSSATALSWSTTTLTIAGDNTASSVAEVCVVGRLT